ncbi:hypothetical protein BLNAU_11859 [Blattamonas nauphoetae]|uniref:Uncharacterized protein n=1 Tax=Blattamonas nauphoetae TaxID=2049346 RepID=A0ABQ9XLD6_9EUKA|nr:hypothetical protein BLNAU_11859 [Blattamonas nauphoetae]
MLSRQMFEKGPQNSLESSFVGFGGVLSPDQSQSEVKTHNFQSQKLSQPALIGSGMRVLQRQTKNEHIKQVGLFPESNPRFKVLTFSFVPGHSHSLERIVRKLIKTFFSPTARTRHRPRLLWLTHNCEAPLDSNRFGRLTANAPTEVCKSGFSSARSVQWELGTNNRYSTRNLRDVVTITTQMKEGSPTHAVWKQPIFPQRRDIIKQSLFSDCQTNFSRSTDETCNLLFYSSVHLSNVSIVVTVETTFVDKHSQLHIVRVTLWDDEPDFDRPDLTFMKRRGRADPTYHDYGVLDIDYILSGARLFRYHDGGRIGLQPQTNIPLSADTLAMFSNPDEGQQTASISPTLLSFALSLREILESVPLASVGTAYQIAVNDLRRAERELGQNKEMEQANPSQGDQLEQVKSSAQTRFMPNREYLAVSLRGPHKDRLVSEFHRFGIPFKMAPSPIDNTSPLNVETVSSHLLPDISSQIKSLAYQMTSIQNYAFDVLPALAQVKQTITNQKNPAAGEDIFRSQYASSQLHPSHIAKLVVTADVQYLHTRLIRNPLRSLFMPVFRDAILPASHSLTVGQSVISDIPSYSLNSSSPASIINGNAFHEDTLPSPTAPVHFDYVSTPSFTSSISDKTTVSMKTHKSDNSDSIPYDVTSSTVGGQVVSIDSETGTVRVTAAPIAGEGTEQTGRGFGHLLMPDRTAISTQTLLDHRHKSCQAFIEAARVFSNEQGKDGILRYRNGEKVCWMQIPIEEEAEDDDPKAMKGKKAKAKKTEPSPIAPQNSKNIEKRKEQSDQEAQEVVRRVFTAHFTRLLHSADPASISKTSSSNTLHKGVSTTTQPSPLLPPDIDFADCDDPDIILLRDCFKDVSLPSHLPIDQAAEESCAIAKPQLREENDRSRRFLTISTPSLSTFQRSSCSPPPPYSIRPLFLRFDLSRPSTATRQRHNTGERVVHHADGTRVFHSFAFGDSPKLVEKYEQETESLAPMKAKLFQQVRGHRIVDPGNSAEKKKKIVITEPDNKHIHFTPVGNVTVDCEHSTKKPAAKFDNRRVDYCQTFNANHPNSVRYDESLELVHVEQRTATVQCDVFKFVTRLASPLAFAPVVTEVTEAYSSKRPHTARRVFFTALDGTAKELEFMEKKLKEKKLKKERIAEQEIDEARKAKLKQSLRNYKSPLSAGLLVSRSGHTHHDVDTDRADITRIAPDIAVHPPSSLRHQTQRHGIRAAPKEGSVSTSLLKPTANNKPVKVSRQSRLLSYASLIALTPSPRPSPSNGASSDRQTQEKTGVICAQPSTDDLHSQNPLLHSQHRHIHGSQAVPRTTLERHTEGVAIALGVVFLSNLLTLSVL